MITELLKEKLAYLSFDLAVQKCFAMEQANKDVQVLQGQGEHEPGNPVNKLDTVKTGKNKPHPSHYLRTLRSLNHVTAVRDQMTHKSVLS